jgi:DNA-binding beta-propeller fold protein YncE
MQPRRGLLSWSGRWGSLVFSLVLAACGSAGIDKAESADYSPGFGGFGGAAGSSGAGKGAAGSAALPPEQELEESYLSPVATGRYVWVANPASGRVAYIDAVSLQIRLIEAGNGPTYVARVGDSSDRVIVLNTLSRDASVLSADGSTLAALSLPVPSGGNRWTTSPDGRFAIAWTDASRVKQPDPVDGYQDITVLDLTTGAETSTALSVGYRPVSVAFDQAMTRAFVVTQDGIAVLSLDQGAPVVTRNIKFVTGAAEDGATRDVAITPDGAYALVRPDQAKEITVVRLGDGQLVKVPLPAAATDLDLTPDGTLAVAVVRDTSQVALLPVPAIFDDPKALQLVTLGSESGVVGSTSLAHAAPLAFLYSNAAPNAVLTFLDLGAADPAPLPQLLRAPISAVLPTEDGSFAVVLHTVAPTGSASSAYKAAFSLVPARGDLPSKIQGLEALVSSVAISPTGDRAILTIGDTKSGPYRALLARFPSLQVEAHDLASPPLAAGIIPEARRAYVAQSHPDGRISFIDLDTGELRTLTGFELGSQVSYGDKKP